MLPDYYYYYSLFYIYSSSSETKLQSQFYRTGRHNSSSGIHKLQLQDCSLTPNRKISELYTLYKYSASCLMKGLELKTEPDF